MSSTNDATVELARVLDGGTAPIYVLDEDRKIIFCNAACAAWLGVSVDELSGQQVAYHTPTKSSTEDDPISLSIAGLCPPPLAFAGQPQVGTVSCQRSDQTICHRRGHFIPLAKGEDEGSPVIAVLEVQDCPPLQMSPDETSADQLHEAVRQFRRRMPDHYCAERLIGNHPRIVQARAQIELAAASSANVMIVGPTGTGKEHVAKAIHYGQPSPGLLVPMDCAVMETNMLRSTLRTLCARRALRPPGSTLLLEQVAEMPAEVQSDLVEMLKDGSLEMRLVAMSDGHLDQRIADSEFSSELAARLGTLVIELPSLAARLEDLPLLVQAMVEELNRSKFRQLAGFSPEALDQLAAYPWPGNLAELQTLVGQMHETSAGPRVTPRDLPKTIQWGAEAAAAPRGDETVVLETFLARVERELIARAMRRAKGNKSKAAKLLGLTRPRLYRRLVQLGLEPAVEKKKAEKKKIDQVPHDFRG